MFSKYEVYTTVQSVYCYPETNVLKNKLNIKEYGLLKKVEEEITSVKQFELLRHPLKGNFTQTHLFNIHKFIFGDIYPFAGKIRKEQIGKANTFFYPPALIGRELNKLFLKIKTERMLKQTDVNVFFDNLSYIMAQLNVIHPFREGNGRTIREFVRVAALGSGYELNWGNVDENDIFNASVASYDDYKALIDVLMKCAGII